jgi:hypothetical protein
VLNVTAKTYRYLDEDEQEADAATNADKGKKKGMRKSVAKKGKQPAGED